MDEQQRRRRREYYRRNRDRLKVYQKAYQERHHAEWAKYMRRYRQEHPEYREWMREYNRHWRAMRKVERKKRRFESLADELLEAA